MTYKELAEQALKEIKEEDRRRDVDALKVKLREKKTLWDTLFPWTITIKRKDHE